MNSLRVVEGKILYECSLNIEGNRRYVHIRCAQGFRWKLPAEPDRLLPIVDACLDAVCSITKCIAQAAKERKASPFLEEAVQKAQAASETAELPVGETKDTLYGHRENYAAQCILFPRWIPRDWPIPAFGQTLAESFRALAHQIKKCNKNWANSIQRLLSTLDGFWDQLLRARKASLASPNSWSVYNNPVFDDSELEIRPDKASVLFNQICHREPDVDDLQASLEPDPDLQDLDSLLNQYLRDELPSLSGGSDLAI